MIGVLGAVMVGFEAEVVGLGVLSDIQRLFTCHRGREGDWCH